MYRYRYRCRYIFIYNICKGVCIFLAVLPDVHACACIYICFLKEIHIYIYTYICGILRCLVSGSGSSLANGHGGHQVRPGLRPYAESTSTAIRYIYIYVYIRQTGRQTGRQTDIHVHICLYMHTIFRVKYPQGRAGPHSNPAHQQIHGCFSRCGCIYKQSMYFFI
jgi:hypothetical protein